MCSTPRGITGKIARHQGRIAAQPKVLNASRHHRKNRQEEEALNLSAFAQVLNASRHHRKNRVRSTRCAYRGRCAQRLAASQEKSPLERATKEYFTERAQRLAASQEKSHFSSGCEFRHCCCAQRLAASQEKSHLSKSSMTAFPFVLNASRHHRKNREAAIDEWLREAKCSTPRGITGKIARERGEVFFSTRSAQRLAASQEKSRKATWHWNRGISSAQRLAASQEKSHT